MGEASQKKNGLMGEELQLAGNTEQEVAGDDRELGESIGTPGGRTA